MLEKVLIKTVILRSKKDTHFLVHSMVKVFKKPFTIALSGKMGAGKTKIVNNLMSEISVKNINIHSPSFNIINIYFSDFPIYHIDLHRINKKKVTKLFGTFLFVVGSIFLYRYFNI